MELELISIFDLVHLTDSKQVAKLGVITILDVHQSFTRGGLLQAWSLQALSSPWNTFVAWICNNTMLLNLNVTLFLLNLLLLADTGLK